MDIFEASEALLQELFLLTHQFCELQVPLSPELREKVAQSLRLQEVAGVFSYKTDYGSIIFK